MKLYLTITLLKKIAPQQPPGNTRLFFLFTQIFLLVTNKHLKSNANPCGAFAVYSFSVKGEVCLISKYSADIFCKILQRSSYLL